jgi:sugar phosphate isomerase/epimerase
VLRLEKGGVVLAIEAINRETYLLPILPGIGVGGRVARCGMCMDAFHMNMEETDPYESVIKAKGRLVDFHVADTNRFACGQGHWDWLKLIGTLRTIGYDGALTVEFVAPVDRSPANKYPEAIEKNPVDISPEQKKFIEDHGSSLLTEEFYSWQVKTCADTLLPLINNKTTYRERERGAINLPNHCRARKNKW